MTENNLGSKIPGQSVNYIVLCLIGLLILILGGIVPANRTIHGLDDNIAVLKSQIEERKILVPLYASLQKQSEKKKLAVLPLPDKGKLAPSLLPTLTQVFRTEAGKSGMALISVVPNLDALTGNAQYIPVDIALRGNFAAFRKFLIQIGGIPYLRHIEEIEVQVQPESRDYKIKLQIAIG